MKIYFIVYLTKIHYSEYLVNIAISKYHGVHVSGKLKHFALANVPNQNISRSFWLIGKNRCFIIESETLSSSPYQR